MRNARTSIRHGMTAALLVGAACSFFSCERAAQPAADATREAAPASGPAQPLAEEREWRRRLMASRPDWTL